MITATVVLVSFLQYTFFQSERKALIDRQIETVASDLIASHLSVDLLDNLDVARDVIESAVKNDRIDQFVNIYSEDSDVLYSNETAKRLSLELNKQAKWQDIVTHDHTLRVLTLKSDDLYIQVGLVLDSAMHRWAVDHQRFLYFLIFILCLVAVVSFFTTRFLFSPIQKLALEFRGLSEGLERQLGQPLNEFVIPKTIERYSRQERANDELEQLGLEIKKFLSRLADYTKSFQAQTALLSHEIKTPLTVIINRLEEMKNASASGNEALISQAMNEAHSLAKTVNSYLQWAVFTSSPGKPEDLYAVKLQSVVVQTIETLNPLWNDRLRLTVVEDSTVFALPEHVRQMVKNLLDNALKYSPRDKSVDVRLTAEALHVQDSGTGIPEEILKSLGTPFNKAKSADQPLSSGLGLAWVQAICRKYDWTLAIHTSKEGTKIEVRF